MTELIELPRLVNPAQRALAGAGIHYLNDLIRFRESDIARLHGIGLNALKILKEALRQNNMDYSKE